MTARPTIAVNTINLLGGALLEGLLVLLSLFYPLYPHRIHAAVFIYMNTYEYRQSQLPLQIHSVNYIATESAFALSSIVVNLE